MTLGLSSTCPKAIKHMCCDFCDGDEYDAKQWLEGPYSQSLTVMELIEHKRDTIRARRRGQGDERARTTYLLRKAHLRPRFCHRAEVKKGVKVGPSSTN